MSRLRAVRAACLAPGLALALFAGAGDAAASADLIRPFAAPQVAAAGGGETAILWSTADGATQAALGTPGAAFGAPVTVAPPGTVADTKTVVMDAAGDVVVVWEAARSRNCQKDVCITDSLGVFAVTRPAGGAFGAPVRLSAAQPFQLAAPRVAMNRAGDWVVMFKQGSDTIVGAGQGATAPSAFTALPVAGFEPMALGIDEAGDVTFAGLDVAHHPAALVRTAGGSFGPLTVLDDALIQFRLLALGVGPQGHAVVVWPAAGVLRSASRPPGGSFGSPVTSGVVAGLPPDHVGIDGQGRTIMLFEPTPAFPARFSLQTRHGTVAAPFGEPVTLSAANRDYESINRFAMGAGGSAALSWTEGEPGANRVALAAIASDAGPFSPSFVLARGTFSDLDTPAVAVDGLGRAVLAWTATGANVQRILAAALTPAAIAGPTVVAQGALVARPVLRSRAAAPARQVLRIRADRTVRPQLTCVSAGPSCHGTLRIDVRPAPGRKLIRLGTHRFRFAAGRSQRVVVRATLAARRAAARRQLTGRITVRTAVNVSGGATVKDVVAVTVRRTRG